jgi:hypothetical protein
MIFEKIEKKLKWKEFSKNPHDAALEYLAKNPSRIYWPFMLTANTNPNVIELLIKVGAFDPITLMYTGSIEIDNFEEEHLWKFISHNNSQRALEIIKANSFMYNKIKNSVELASNSSTETFNYLANRTGLLNGLPYSPDFDLWNHLFSNPNPLAMQFFEKRLHDHYEKSKMFTSCHVMCVESLPKNSLPFFDLLLKLESKTPPLKPSEIWFVRLFKSGIAKMAANPNAANYLASKPMEFYSTESLEWLNIDICTFWQNLSGNSTAEAVAILKHYPDKIHWKTFCEKNSHPDAYKYMQENQDSKIYMAQLAMNPNPDMVKLAESSLRNLGEDTCRDFTRLLLGNPSAVELLENNKDFVMAALERGDISGLACNTNPRIVSWILACIDKFTSFDDLSKNPVIFEPLSDELYVLK